MVALIIILIVVFFAVCSVLDERNKKQVREIQRAKADKEIEEIKKEYEEKKKKNPRMEFYYKQDMEREIEKIERELNPLTREQLDKQRAMSVHAEANFLMR